MQIIIDTKTDSHDDLRSAAAFLLHIVGDLGKDDEETPAPKAPTPPPPPPVLTVTAPQTGVITNAAIIPPPPPVPVGTNSDEGEDTEAPSNVVQGNFSQPSQGSVPPPPPVMTQTLVGTAENPTVSGTPVTTIAAQPNAQTTNPALAGVDSAGMPYDARIHQKTGNKKKDGTWKLIKGIDPAVVAKVTAEISAAKAAAPASGTVLLPPTQTQQPGNTVPVPPPPPVAAPNNVPAPPATAPVPVPPVAAVGVVGGVNPFRELIDKITTATKENKITPQDVSRLCQHRGAPNLMQLNAMPELLPRVTADVDAVLAGLSVDAVIAGLG